MKTVLLVFVLCVIGAALGKLQTSARKAERLDIVSQVVHGLTDLPSDLIGGAMDRISDTADGFSRGDELVSENRRLKNQSEALKLYDERVEELQSEIDSLRKLIGLSKTVASKKIPARIIGIALYEHRITLSVGSRSGVIPGSAVISGDGLLAVVQTVQENNCQAALLTSPVQKVGAVALRSPAIPGILRGETGDTLLLELLDTSNPIEPGDMVVTSGLSERIEKGIPIGRVFRVDTDSDFGTRRARIRPSARLGTTREVLILK